MMNLKELEPTLAPPLSGGDRSSSRRSVAGDYDSHGRRLFGGRSDAKSAHDAERSRSGVVADFSLPAAAIAQVGIPLSSSGTSLTECRRRRLISDRRHPRHTNDLLCCIGCDGTTPPWKM